MVWYSHLFKNLPHFVVIHIVKGFSVVNEAEVGIFLEHLCFPYDLMNDVNLTSDSSASFKTQPVHLEVLVHLLVKPSLKNFEHNLSSMWNECNCLIV